MHIYELRRDQLNKRKHVLYSFAGKQQASTHHASEETHLSDEDFTKIGNTHEPNHTNIYLQNKRTTVDVYHFSNFSITSHHLDISQGAFSTENFTSYLLLSLDYYYY